LLLDGNEWPASHSGRFTPGKEPPVPHWIGGWMGPRTGLDYMEGRKILLLPGLERQPLGRLARCQSILAALSRLIMMMMIIMIIIIIIIIIIIM
jgi:hypothetical protein